MLVEEPMLDGAESSRVASAYRKTQCGQTINKVDGRPGDLETQSSIGRLSVEAMMMMMAIDHWL